jgi:hypothetical protein
LNGHYRKIRTCAHSSVRQTADAAGENRVDAVLTLRAYSAAGA